MNSDNKGKEYATKDISNMVGIASPTVRKYAQALEKAGYSFMKNEKGFRIFLDKDIFAFNEIKNMSKKTAMPVEKVAEMIVFNKQQGIQHEATSDTPEIIESDSAIKGDIVQYDSRYNELMDKLSKLDMLDDIVNELQEQKAFNNKLLEKLDQQQKYIDEKLDSIDQRLIKRDTLLVDSMRATLETKQAQMEAAATQQKEKNKSIWARLFGK
jgi:biotin operon repressor